jgi:hypothetical protein
MCTFCAFSDNPGSGNSVMCVEVMIYWLATFTEMDVVLCCWLGSLVCEEKEWPVLPESRKVICGEGPSALACRLTIAVLLVPGCSPLQMSGCSSSTFLLPAQLLVCPPNPCSLLLTLLIGVPCCTLSEPPCGLRSVAIVLWPCASLRHWGPSWVHIPCVQQ